MLKTVKIGFNILFRSEFKRFCIHLTFIKEKN